MIKKWYPMCAKVTTICNNQVKKAKSFRFGILGLCMTKRKIMACTERRKQIRPVF